MLVSDAMTQNFRIVPPEMDLYAAAELMLTQGLDSLLVMQAGCLVGIVGMRDLFTAPVPAAYGGRMRAKPSEPQWAADWRAIPIATVATSHVMTVPEGLPLLRAAELMVNSGKHPLPVLRGGQVVGVVDRRDVVRLLLAAGGAPGRH